MKDVDAYLKEVQNPREQLPSLLKRVQDEAFAAGYNTAAGKLFEIAHDTDRRVEAQTTQLLRNGQHG